MPYNSNMDKMQQVIVSNFIENEEKATFIISNYECADIVEWPRRMDFPIELLVVCTTEGKRGVYNSSGDLIVPCKYSSIEPVSYDGLTEFSQGGISSLSRKYGYGSILEDFHKECDLNLISQDNNLKIFYKDSVFYIYYYGHCIFEIYDAEKFGGISEGLICIMRNGKWGAIDFHSDVIIPFEYENSFTFKNSRAVVKIKKELTIPTFNKKLYIDRFGVIDVNNSKILPFIFQSLENDGIVFRGEKNQLWGLYDTKGQELIPHKYQKLFRFSEGLIGAALDDKVGFIDIHDNIVIPFKYIYCEHNEPIFSDGVACVLSLDDNGKEAYGYINHFDKLITPFCYDYDVMMKNNAIENVTSEYNAYGRLDYKKVVFVSGLSIQVDQDFTEIDDSQDFDSISFGRSNSNNDILDAYEGDYDAMWNTD